MNDRSVLLTIVQRLAIMADVSDLSPSVLETSARLTGMTKGEVRMPDDHEQVGNAELLSQILDNLESRIARIEKELNLEPIQLNKTTTLDERGERVEKTGDSLELRIGLYWFAKVGIVALMIGVAFLLLRPFNELNPAFASILGYVISAGVMLVSRLLRKASPLLSGYLLGGGLALLFLSTLRLHYFSSHPVLHGRPAEVVLLLLIVIIGLAVSVRRKSIYLVSLSLIMGFTTGLLSEQLYSYFGITLIFAALTVYFSLKHGWQNLLIYGIAVTYFTDLVWFLNDPLVGNSLALRTIPYSAAFFIFFWTILFAFGTALRAREEKESVNVILSSLLNAALGYGLFFLTTVSKFQDRLEISHLAASVVFLALAIAFWLKEKSRYQTFFYAMTGYAALSVAIVADFGTPNFFILLCWQSLLVVSTAVWFQSKFIVVTNFIIYSIIFVAYLALAGTVSVTSLSFGVVALLSARILNWQQKRLELKTDKMRTAYLVAAFFIFPYALYHTVPIDYVSLSWLAVAVVYYVISLILKNMKYRWMALLTFLLTALYLIIIGIIKLEPVFRIVSFLVLGVVLLVISFFYTRTRMKSGGKDN
ncbi:MAG: DUF2339 domain-containing protein [Bacteroidetes bacterium]|nr:DUF2339 domain-containing protein [Bacteroidota bacterium]